MDFATAPRCSGTGKQPSLMLSVPPSDKQPFSLCLSRTTLRATWQSPLLCPPCYASWPTSCLSTGRSTPTSPTFTPSLPHAPLFYSTSFHLNWWSPKLEAGSLSLPCSLQIGAGAWGSSQEGGQCSFAATYSDAQVRAICL